jgi:NADH-quinone oxidoreductase subunit N
MKALIILFVAALVLLFAGVFKKRSALMPVALVGVLAALAATIMDLSARSDFNMQYASMMAFDQYALAFTAVTLTVLALLIGLSGWSFRQLSDTLGDNYGLIFFSACGALCMFSFTNMVMLFLGIEILSIPLYVLAGSRRDDPASNEAALKYFLMGAFATGILLFGMTLVYGSTASFDTKVIADAIAGGVSSPMMLKTGIVLILIGLFFKISAAPFHFWAPDVYTGSPNFVTAFMATIVKTAGVAAFYRLFFTAFIGVADFWTISVAVVAALTMTVANLTAIYQTDFKRMMAYSSISHAGYLLLGILAIGNAGASGALLLYLLTYSVATVCAFAAYMAVTEPRLDGSFASFNGLGKTQPILAAVMAICMLSLAGIPPLAGFFGKYFLFAAAFERYPWLVVLAVINSAISIFYYFKVIIAMYFSKEDEQAEGTTLVPVSFAWVLAIGVVLIASLTFLPDWVYRLI